MPPPDVTKLEGYEPPPKDKGPSDLDYVKDQAGRDAIKFRDAAAQTVGRASQASDKENLETLQDAATMVPGGVLDDWDDELMGHLGAIGAALGSPLESPAKTAPKGYRMARDAQRARKAIASKRSPVGSVFGYGVGAVGQQMVAGPALRGVTGVGGRLARLATGTERAAEGAGVGARALTGAGNAALPGAIIGAGQADSLEDVPLNAAMGGGLGLAVSGAVHAPGAIRRMAGSAKYVGRPAEEFADDAFLRAAGLNKGQIRKIAEKPGGKKAYIKRMRDLDIGNDWIPTNQRIEEQATQKAEELNAQSQALADQAKDLRIPKEEVAAELDRRAGTFAQDGDRPIVEAIRGEARQWRGGKDAPPPAMPPPPFDPRVPVDAVIEEPLTPGLKGLPPGAPSTEITPRQYTHTSPLLPSGDGPAPDPVQAQAQFLKPAEPGPSKTFAELIRDRQAYHKGAFESETAVGQRTNRNAGRAINDILEAHANELPGEIGTPWRQNNRKLNTALDALKYARAGQGGGNLGKGLKIGGMITAAVSGNPSVLAGLVGTVPGVQMRMAQGLGMVSRAAAKPPGTLERVLSRITPSGSNVGRQFAHGQAQESITAVQEAALRGDEALHSEHYRRMLTDPDYNRWAMGED